MGQIFYFYYFVYLFHSWRCAGHYEIENIEHKKYELYNKASCSFTKNSYFQSDAENVKTC